MLLFVLKEVSELVRAKQELKQLVPHDALIGLHNRWAANERLRDEFLRMKRSSVVYSVPFVLK